LGKLEYSLSDPRKNSQRSFFSFGRYRSGTINLLILEDSDDSSNVSFLGPMEFIGIKSVWIRGCQFYFTNVLGL